MERNIYTKEQLVQYWVGLMDGDGSIQVNHWREKSLQYRLIIKLLYTEANVHMLQLLTKAVGGSVRIDKDKQGTALFVKWVVNDTERAKQLLKVFERYPPQTTRLQLQIKFLLECLEHNSVIKYLETRGKKYDTMQQERLRTKTSEISDVWLAGFTEAEGCFSYRTGQKIVGFSISQKNDRHLIEAIREKLGIVGSIVREQSKDQWTIETLSQFTVKGIISYYTRVPLLGEKRVSLELAKKRIQDRAE